jgi:hypothetical protein
VGHRPELVARLHAMERVFLYTFAGAWQAGNFKHRRLLFQAVVAGTAMVALVGRVLPTSFTDAVDAKLAFLGRKVLGGSHTVREGGRVRAPLNQQFFVEKNAYLISVERKCLGTKYNSNIFRSFVFDLFVLTHFWEHMLNTMQFLLFSTRINRSC